jgi:branched-chain amino acid transport system permease protein
MDILASILVPTLIDAIAVLGLYVIAASGRLSAGHAAFFGIGGYASGLVSVHLGLPVLVSLVAGVLFSAICGALFALLADRLTHWFFAVATLALAAMVLGLVSGLDALGGATGLYHIPLWTGMAQAVAGLVVAVALVVWLDASVLGRAMRAVRDSELAARSLAIDPTRVRVIAFTIGAGLAGLAGGLWAHSVGIIKPSDMSLEHSLLYLVYLSIGGVDLWIGALVGTFLLSLLPEVVRFSGQYRLTAFGALLTLVMIVRPAGLVTWREIDRIRSLFRGKRMVDPSETG